MAKCRIACMSEQFSFEEFVTTVNNNCPLWGAVRAALQTTFPNNTNNLVVYINGDETPIDKNYTLGDAVTTADVLVDFAEQTPQDHRTTAVNMDQFMNWVHNQEDINAALESRLPDVHEIHLSLGEPFTKSSQKHLESQQRVEENKQLLLTIHKWPWHCARCTLRELNISNTKLGPKEISFLGNIPLEALQKLNMSNLWNNNPILSYGSGRYNRIYDRTTEFLKGLCVVDTEKTMHEWEFNSENRAAFRSLIEGMERNWTQLAHWDISSNLLPQSAVTDIINYVTKRRPLESFKFSPTYDDTAFSGVFSLVHSYHSGSGWRGFKTDNNPYTFVMERRASPGFVNVPYSIAETPRYLHLLCAVLTNIYKNSDASGDDGDDGTLSFRCGGLAQSNGGEYGLDIQDSIPRIVDALRYAHIKYLDVSNCRIGHKNAAALYDCLARLLLSEEHCSLVGINILGNELGAASSVNNNDVIMKYVGLLTRLQSVCGLYENSPVVNLRNDSAGAFGGFEFEMDHSDAMLVKEELETRDIQPQSIDISGQDIPESMVGELHKLARNQSLIGGRVTQEGGYGENFYFRRRRWSLTTSLCLSIDLSNNIEKIKQLTLSGIWCCRNDSEKHMSQPLIRAIAQLITKGGLEVLNLSHNKIKDVTLGLLVSALACDYCKSDDSMKSNMRHMDLSKNCIGSIQGAQHIASLAVQLQGTERQPFYLNLTDIVQKISPNNKRKKEIGTRQNFIETLVEGVKSKLIYKRNVAWNLCANRFTEKEWAILKAGMFPSFISGISGARHAAPPTTVLATPLDKRVDYTDMNLQWHEIATLAAELELFDRTQETRQHLCLDFSKNPDMFGKKMDHISKAADLIRAVNNSPFTEVRFMNNWDHSKKKLKLVKATFGHQTNKFLVFDKDSYRHMLETRFQHVMLFGDNGVNNCKWPGLFCIYKINRRLERSEGRGVYESVDTNRKLYICFKNGRWRVGPLHWKTNEVVPLLQSEHGSNNKDNSCHPSIGIISWSEHTNTYTPTGTPIFKENPAISCTITTVDQTHKIDNAMQMNFIKTLRSLQPRPKRRSGYKEEEQQTTKRAKAQ